MKVKIQKNVMFVDLSKNIYKGYIETSIALDKEDKLYYKFLSLEILSIKLSYQGGTAIVPKYKLFFLRDQLVNPNDSLSENLWKHPMTDLLEIDLSQIDKEEVLVKIEYRPLDTNTSVLFYSPVFNDDKHKEVVGLNRHGYSYELFPSVKDDNRVGYPWELTYILPNTEEYKIVSPGILRSFSEEEKTNISMYFVEESIPGFINFAIGTFERFEIQNGDDKKVILLPMNLDEYNECVNELVDDAYNVLKYTEHFFQRGFPFPNLNILFSMNELDLTLGIGTAICNISNLSPSKDIEQSFTIKRTIANIVASQIFYFYVHYSEITDFWIFCGLKGYFEDYCVRFLLGHNDFLYTLKEETDFVFDNDIYEPALCDSRRDFISYQSEFFIKKSKLVFHTLENNLSKAFLAKICNFTLKRTNDQIGNNFTHDFILFIKDITGKDMKSFFDTYVFTPGLVKLCFKFTIDKKKSRVDFKVEQIPTSKLSICNTKIHGFVSVKSHEVEGVYDHSFNLNQDNHFYYHTRTKKKKKPDEEEEEVMPLLWIRIDPKREHLVKGIVEQPDYMFIEQLLDKNLLGQLEAIDYLLKRPSLQICEAFERILENSQMFYKLRVRALYALSKANLENYVGFQRIIQFFIKKFCVQSSTVIKPNDFNYTNYFLQKHSIKALSLSDPFIVKNYNGRLVGSASIICAFMINILRFNDNSMNNYSDSLYISSVIENLIRPILAMRVAQNAEIVNYKDKKECKNVFGNEEPLASSKDFVLGTDSSEESHNSNDNLTFLEPEPSSTSSISDNQTPLVSETIDYIEISIREIERYRLLDMVFPSHNNVITESSLYFLGRLAINGCVGFKLDVLKDLSRFPNAIPVRKAAITLLLLLFPFKDTIRFVFTMLLNDNYLIKRAIVDAFEEILTKEIVNIREILKEYKKDLQGLFYDFLLRDKIENILALIDGNDQSEEDFNANLLKYYDLKYEKDFYYKKMMLTNENKISDPIRIRLLNFKEMQMEYLKTTFILKLTHNNTGINTHGPSRKRRESKKTEKPVEEVKVEKELLKEEKIVQPPLKEEKKEEVEQQDDELVSQIKKLEEANVKEMLNDDPLTEELLSSYVESKPATSPFIPSKNNVNHLKPFNEIKIATPLEQPLEQNEAVKAKDEELAVKVKDKKFYLKGLLSEMRRTIDQNINRINLWRERQQERIESERRQQQTANTIDLEQFLLEDDEEENNVVGENEKTLETLLEVDYHETPTVAQNNIVDIDSFLDGDCREGPMVGSYDRRDLCNAVPLKLRLKISWTMRIKAANMQTVQRPSQVEKRTKGRFGSLNSILPIDLTRLSRAQRIYYETIRDVSLKQFNSLIIKNRDKKFFSWTPKTFQEIEEMVADEIGYSSISKELERALVFILTYSVLGTRPYQIAKKMAESFESMRYYYTTLPAEVTEMTPILKKTCLDFLNTLLFDESFVSFIKPVNVDLHKTYVDVVRFPMCLEIIQKKMSVYQSLEAFYGDIRQISKNCFFFNQNSSEICNNARKLLRYISEFNRNIHRHKRVHDSFSVLKALTLRFSCSSIYDEINYKIDNKLYKTFFELFSDVDRIKNNYLRETVSPLHLSKEIEDFKAQIYHWFNVIEGKSICFGL